MEAADVGLIGRFIEARLKKRGDGRRAIEAAAKHFSKSERVIERRWKAYRENPLARLYQVGQRLLASQYNTARLARLMPPVQEMQFILRWIPMMELEKLEPIGDGAHTVLLRIAREREELERLRKSQESRRKRRYHKTRPQSPPKKRA